ncbi:MAG: hypothetical protein RBG13Loki_0798 [Promethearchaeota archaeon CR_4]|nr:MAG: hypothetical protein RBG13Loki_0798 [Candidatus Lokiarchaeota archaeon CR_4]
MAKLQSWVEFLLDLLAKNDVVYENEIIKKLAAEFGIRATNYHLDLCKLFITRRIPDKEPLIERIRNKSLDRLRDGLWL